MKERFLKKLPVFLFILGTVLFGKGVYIHAKAQVAQLLLNRAWEKTLAGEKNAKPWGWADTHPVAKLTFVKGGDSFIILEGSTGSSLAFGPGHMAGTPLPGEPGNCVIAGHRDTQFSVLCDIKKGDELLLQKPDGKNLRYIVTNIIITDYKNVSVLKNGNANSLTLITCYPFDAVIPGGPLRYIVQAELIVSVR
jgi:sortase A